MHFKAMPTPKPRTLKQNAQEAQTPTEAPAITATTTAATIAIITVRFRLCMSMEWMNECVDGLFITQLLKA
jgi:hypothetical protein